jgi:hypothetical protein
MTDFWEFKSGYAGREDVWEVVDYELHGFDVTSLWTGKELQKGLSGDIRIIIHRVGEAPDWLINPISWPIVSSRLAECLEGCAQADIQVLDAPLYDSNSGAALGGYHIVNVFKTSPCLDVNQSRFIRSSVSGRISVLTQAVIRRESVDERLRIFRLSEHFPTIICRRRVAEEIRQSKFLGLSVNECTVV